LAGHVEQQVARLDVAVHDPHGVGVLQRLGRLRNQPSRRPVELPAALAALGRETGHRRGRRVPPPPGPLARPGAFARLCPRAPPEGGGGGAPGAPAGGGGASAKLLGEEQTPPPPPARVAATFFPAPQPPPPRALFLAPLHPPGPPPP